MGKVLGFLFDRLVDPLGLPIEAWKEYLILLAIGEVAYIIAFYVVGRMYNGGDIQSRAGGSIFHWGIRAVVFFVMWAVTYGVIWIANFVSSYYWWLILGLVTVAIILTVVRACINHTYNKRNTERK